MGNNHFSLKLAIAWLLVLTLYGGNLFGQQANEMATEMSSVKSHMDADIQWGPCPPFMPEGCGIAVLHGDPAKNNVDIFFKVQANSDIPKHWHNSAERMILVSGKLFVTYDGEKEVVMNTGSYAFGPASKPHVARCGDDGPCVIFIAFEEPLDAFPIVEKE
ncbi:cupin domain-containing protein [Flavobacteriaceae bacterium KMM 6897]|nr:cupin domain-containing protein [Flavobacteriaceae bacterium KMM 6897]MEB8345428.1 cupin domain-containing protein [Flavobacteriaceae bacterium KMM 6898]